MARVLLVEPYYGGSHRAWADGLVGHSGHEITLITHDAAFWRWRMRGGAVTLAEQVAAAGPADVLMVTDMVDVAALVGHARQALAGVPVVLYMHENQLLYPDSPKLRPDETFAWINWSSLVVADLVVFNSHYHREALLAALPRLLSRAPDHPHGSLLEGIGAKAEVLHVGVDTHALIEAPRRPHSGPPLIVWNQRWDHDKDPGALFRSLVQLAGDGVDFRLALAGENQRLAPREFEWVVDQLGQAVTHIGALPRAEYIDLLLTADVVASTAEHEFFGVAIVEAIAAGCRPVLPARLSYPELIPEPFHPFCLYDQGGLRPALRRAIDERVAPKGLRESMDRFDWRALAPRYDELLHSLA